jgi:hypothetical protein
VLFIASGCASQPAPERSPESAEGVPVLAPAAPASATTAPVAEVAPPPSAAEPAPAPPVETLESRLTELRAEGFPKAADLIASRVAQSRQKMKLEPEQGFALAASARELYPALPTAQKLLGVMPKASVELVRSVAERGVSREEGERMAAYLIELHTALDMENPSPLDENTSHVIGREWHEIDYRGEGMTWEKQKSIYEPKGIPDFKTEAHLRRFFEVESKAPYFVKLYKPRGGAP